MQKEIDMNPTPHPYDIAYYLIQPMIRDNIPHIYTLYVKPKPTQQICEECFNKMNKEEEK